jgi:SAM-dependent methyltransferase
MNPSLTLALLWLVVFVVIVFLVMSSRGRRRRGGTMTAAVGAVWDLQTDQKRKALEIIVEKRAEARDPEDAEGDLPDLELPEGADDFSRLEFRGWQRAASKYDQSWSRLTRQFIPALIEAAGVKPGMRVLDVACGPGYVSEAVQAAGARPIGVDFSPEMLRIARARCPEIEFRHGDAQRLDFDDEQFDAVVMNFGLLHVANPELAMAEAARVLRGGARYAFTVWGGPDDSPAAKAIEEAISAHADLTVPLPKGPDRFGDDNVAGWRNRLAPYGFRPESVTVSTVHATWHVPTASYLFDIQLNASVRAAAILRAQTPEALEAIKRQMEAAVQPYADATGFALPYVGYVISAAAQ